MKFDRRARGPSFDRPCGFVRSYMLLGGGKESFGFRVLSRSRQQGGSIAVLWEQGSTIADSP